MTTRKITFDEAIADSMQWKKRHLIVGDGFSIAARPNIFTYGSLFDASGIEADERLSAVFEALSTTDFEVAIHSLEFSAKLAPIYSDDVDMAREAMLEDASRLKDILIRTVAENHPAGPFDMTRNEFLSCQEFLSHFMMGNHAGIVFTVNYDLLLTGP